jgi:RNA polymerase sigma-54 factor
MEQQLHLQQKTVLRQHLSAQKLRLVGLLGLPVLEFEQCVRNELDDNPALQIPPTDPSTEPSTEDVRAALDDSEYISSYISSYLGSKHNATNDFQAQIPDRSTGQQYNLTQQIAILPLGERERMLCTYLLGMLDSDGCLRRSLADVADDMLFANNIETTPQEWASALHIVQSLEPAGIGASNLQECLLLQLRRRAKPSESVLLAIKILGIYFNEFVEKKYAVIIKKEGITQAEFDAAATEIRKLNPKPGALLTDNDVMGAVVIVPDFFVENHNGNLLMSIAPKHMPKLAINKRYSELALRTGMNSHAFVEQKNNEAAWFINAIKQRAQTLESIMSAILKHQEKFFLTGDDADLRPLSQVQIAKWTGYDKSTISRAIANKYVQTAMGIFALEHFFVSQTASLTGEQLSAVHLQEAIAEIIDDEDKESPLADADIVPLLRKRGFDVARRTVAKYREMQGIPPSHVRKGQE